MQYVRGPWNCVTCSSAPVVVITITGPAWTLLLLPASVLGGSALSAKCAKPAGNLGMTLRCWSVRHATKDTTLSA